MAFPSALLVGSPNIQAFSGSGNASACQGHLALFPLYRKNRHQTHGTQASPWCLPSATLGSGRAKLILLWVLGVPLSVIILLMLFGFLR
jgi:hypothetical protein